MSKPHDALFKKVMQIPTQALLCLQNLIPATVIADLDLSTLELFPESMLDEYLQPYFSDVVYECKFKNAEEAKICFLFEHKSYPDRYVLLQVLAYQALQYRKQAQDGKMQLIIPIIFIHNWGGSKIKSIPELFDVPNHFYHQYLPTSAYELINVDNVSDSTLRIIRQTFLYSMMLLFQTGGNKEHLLTKLQEILNFVRNQNDADLLDDMIVAFATYIVKVYELNKFEMSKIAKELPPKVEKKFFSTADRLWAEGEAAGKTERDAVFLGKNIESAINLILTIPRISDEQRAQIILVETSFIKEVCQVFATPDLKKRKKTFRNFYKAISMNADLWKLTDEVFERINKKILNAHTKL